MVSIHVFLYAYPYALHQGHVSFNFVSYQQVMPEAAMSPSVCALKMGDTSLFCEAASAWVASRSQHNQLVMRAAAFSWRSVPVYVAGQYCMMYAHSMELLQELGCSHQRCDGDQRT